ncbi:hypothetical protein M0802_011952 [Mischocyttarus mexicanus]|nr:hypothetical protein M0802_011952 [Mischocyttarus mexicanus]
MRVSSSAKPVVATLLSPSLAGTRQCVKCSGQHATAECRKSADTLQTCFFCDTNHTANYKICSHYQELLKKTFFRFLARGDFNAKHNIWADNETTYLPTSVNKIPGLHDFFITKNLSPRYIHVCFLFNLSSDHCPIIATINTTIIENNLPISLYNRLTNWDYFRETFNITSDAALLLKTTDDADYVVNHLTHNIILAARASTPCLEYRNFMNSPFQLSSPIKPCILMKIKTTIAVHANPKKASSLDLTNRKMIKEEQEKGIVFITTQTLTVYKDFNQKPCGTFAMFPDM